MPEELVTMPELVRDGSMRGLVSGARQTLKLPPPKNYPPETSPALEPGHGKHDEGGALSAHARSCVEAVRQR